LIADKKQLLESIYNHLQFMPKYPCCFYINFIYNWLLWFW